jgi:hypothetical protein
MTKTEAEEARRALDHACAALTDGAGQEQWGPGVIADKLWYRRGLGSSLGSSKGSGMRAAIFAFERAANAAWALFGYKHRDDHFTPELEAADVQRMAEQTRKIAFCILELVIADAE